MSQVGGEGGGRKEEALVAGQGRLAVLALRACAVAAAAADAATGAAHPCECERVRREDAGMLRCARSPRAPSPIPAVRGPSLPLPLLRLSLRSIAAAMSMSGCEVDEHALAKRSCSSARHDEWTRRRHSAREGWGRQCWR